MEAQTAKNLTGLAALIATSLTANAQYTYTTLDDPLAATNGAVYPYGTVVTGISGTNIVGYYADTNGTTHGFVCNGIGWTTLDDPLAEVYGDDPGVLQTYAQGISGTNIVGYYFAGSHMGGFYHGFVFDGSAWADFAEPQNGVVPFTYAQGIDATNIVGYYLDGTFANHGFLYNGSTSAALDAPLAGSGNSQGTFPSGISGTNIIGHYLDTSNYVHGFLFDGSTWITLHYPSGVGDAYPTAIDGTNIMGSYTDTNGVGHGFLYNGSTWLTLEVLPGEADGISGVNIVGTYYDSNNVAHGFLATPIPQLTITPSGNALKLSWPSWANNYVLQQCFDLTSGNWVPAPEPPMLNASSGQYEVTLNPVFVLQNSRYNFRLKQE